MTNVGENMDNVRENTNQLLSQSASLRNPSPHFARLGREIGKRVYEWYGRKEDGTIDTQAQEEYSRIVALACVSFFMGNGLMILLGGFFALFQQIISASPLPIFTYGFHGTMLVLLGTGMTFIKGIISKKNKDDIYQPEYTAVVHVGIFVFVIGSLLLMFSNMPELPIYGLIPLTMLFGGLWLTAEAWLIGVFDEEVDWKARILEPIKHRETVKKAVKNLLSRELISICVSMGIIGTIAAAFIDVIVYKLGGATGFPNEHLNAAFPFIGSVFRLPISMLVGGVATGTIGCLYLYGAAMIWLGSGGSLRRILHQPVPIIKVTGALAIYFILNVVLTGILILILPMMMSPEFSWGFVIAPLLLVGVMYVFIPVFLSPYFVARLSHLLYGFKSAWTASKRNRITALILIWVSIMIFLTVTLVFLVTSTILYAVIEYIAPAQWNMLWIQGFSIFIALFFGQLSQVAIITNGVEQLWRDEYSTL